MRRILPAAIAFLVAGFSSAAEPVPGAADAATMAPRVNTSPAAPAGTTPPAAPESTAAPASSTIDRSAGPAVVTSPAAAPSTPAARGTAPAPGSRPAPGAGRAQDRLDLEATQITGNRELPRVMYVVPWKRSDVGAGPGRPANSLLDEVLSPVDRDVFLRQGRYYEALRPDAPAAP